MTGEERGNCASWARFAPLYDLQLRLERPALRTLARMLAIRSPDRVLDLGTGTGAMLCELQALPDPPRVAVGVDDSGEMLSRVPPLPAAWELVEADASALPFAAASFDRVSAAYLLHVLDAPTRARALVEIHRVLAPGGLLGSLTVAPPRGRISSAARKPLEQLAGAYGGVFAGLCALDPAPELERAGSRPLRGRRIRRGYPSLVVVAERV